MRKRREGRKEGGRERGGDKDKGGRDRGREGEGTETNQYTIIYSHHMVRSPIQYRILHT